MTKEQWDNLKPNDCLLSSCGTLRRVIDSNGKGCIRLRKLKRSWTGSLTTVYTSSSCKSFEKIDIEFDKESNRFYFTSPLLLQLMNNMKDTLYDQKIFPY